MNTPDKLRDAACDPDDWDMPGLLRDAADEIERLAAIIAHTLPYLEEAREACFRGQEERMLSAEERGMGRLLATFREIADGKPALPPGLITQREATKQAETAVEWAHRTLGSPNKLREPLRQYVHVGETCATGLERAHAEIERLRGALEEIKNRPRGREFRLEETPWMVTDMQKIAREALKNA